MQKKYEPIPYEKEFGKIEKIIHLNITANIIAYTYLYLSIFSLLLSLEEHIKPYI
jgi:hypothetical protein